MYNSFHPGQTWLDTNGNRIQAHGGSVLYRDGTYYWYGENKEKTDGTTNIWTWGIRCYTSTDLYNWDDRGLIIPPNPDDPEDPMYPEHKIDRPHILYNETTGKYVCWVKIMDDETQTQAMTIFEADDILGPYELVRTGFRPLDMNAGDFDLGQDPDGKAYLIFDKVHTDIIIADLTEDYLDVSETFSSHFHHDFPPYSREAPAHFERNGQHYLITSGTTGYFPNASEAAVANRWHGPYRILGDPHRGDPTNTSFHSQISCIFPVQGRDDLYIAMSDRWKPNYMQYLYEDYAKAFEKAFNPNFTGTVEMDKLPKMPAGQISENTSTAEYVWLPLKFEGDMVSIDWMDEWKL